MDGQFLSKSRDMYEDYLVELKGPREVTPRRRLRLQAVLFHLSHGLGHVQHRRPVSALVLNRRPSRRPLAAAIQAPVRGIVLRRRPTEIHGYMVLSSTNRSLFLSVPPNSVSR